VNSCSDNVENYYSNYRASFQYSPVASVAPLYTSLNNMGEYCMIWRNSDNFYFEGQDEKIVTKTKTAETIYNNWVCLKGFIVGVTNIPEIGNDLASLVAYDLACPYCYEKDLIISSLQYDGYGFVKCTRCGRRYNLNNGGIVVNGIGPKLIRYKISTNGVQLNIYN